MPSIEHGMEETKTAAPFGLTGQSSSEVLISTMEEFGVCEAEAVIVVFIDQQGNTTIKSNAKRCLALGLLSMATDLVRGVGAMGNR